MPSYKIVQTLYKNLQGNPINGNSIVKFKTWQQNDQTGLVHNAHINKNQIKLQLTPIILSLHQGDKVQLQLTRQNQKSKKILLEILQVKEGQELQQNYVKADILKNKGNQYVKTKNYQQAAKFYAQGLRLIQYDCRPQAQTVKISLLSNLSLAYLNTKNYEECIKMCDKHLTSSLQSNKKIVYRRANANKFLKNWIQAQNDIKYGLEICENDEEGRKDFQQLTEMLKKQKKLQGQKQKKVYSKMFG